MFPKAFIIFQLGTFFSLPFKIFICTGFILFSQHFYPRRYISTCFPFLNFVQNSPLFPLFRSFKHHKSQEEDRLLVHWFGYCGENWAPLCSRPIFLLDWKLLRWEISLSPSAHFLYPAKVRIHFLNWFENNGTRKRFLDLCSARLCLHKTSLT